MNLAPRYVTTGRADPWSNPPPRRFRAMRPTDGLQPMDQPRARKGKSDPYFVGLAVIVFGYFIFRGMF